MYREYVKYSFFIYINIKKFDTCCNAIYSCIFTNSTRDIGISFNQLCKDENQTFSYIKFQKDYPSCNKELKCSDIIKGYEYDKRKYVIISNDD